jgi:streptomycin 6-kinase
MLIERCEPGTLLGRADPDTALRVLADLLPRLWTPVGEPFRPLAEEASEWIESMPADRERAGRPFARKILDEAIDLLATLSQTQGEHVLLHQDLHSDNVLAARLDRLTSELGLDRERAVGWTVGQSVACAFDSTYIRTHIETVHRLLAAAA